MRRKKERKIDHPLYSIYRGMKTRCSNPKQIYYNGRGITVCEEWKNDFFSFVKDMGERPSLKHVLDRIDNEKGYFKDNCRWATISQSNRNKRSCNSTGYKGVSKSYKKWSAKIKYKNKLLYIGTFISIKEAIEAYNKKSLELFKEDAYLNKYKGEDNAKT